MLKPVPVDSHDHESHDREKTSQRQPFWELIGLRLLGMKQVLIGAVEFQRQSEGTDARQALSHYLSNPPRRLDPKMADYPAHLLRVATRPPERGLKEFVRGLNKGDEPRFVLFDIDMLQLCFDFRKVNPSLERNRFQSQGGTRMCFRTINGDVLTGLLHSPIQRLRRTDNFFGVSRVIQHTALGELPMPDLIVHRGFFAAMSECAEEKLLSPVFDPSTESVQPLVGLPAWRFFMAGRTDDTKPGSKGSVLVAGA